MVLVPLIINVLIFVIKHSFYVKFVVPTSVAKNILMNVCVTLMSINNHFVGKTHVVNNTPKDAIVILIAIKIPNDVFLTIHVAIVNKNFAFVNVSIQVYHTIHSPIVSVVKQEDDYGNQH